MDNRHARDAQATAKRQWGAGWAHLSNDQKRGAVALAYLEIVSGQEAPLDGHAGRIITGAQEIVEAIYPAA